MADGRSSSSLSIMIVGEPVYGDLMSALQAGQLTKQPLERDIRALMERFI